MQQANMYEQVRRALTDKLADYDASVRGLDMSVYVAAPTAGASAGLTGALAIAHRTITRQWPMHWAIGAQQNSVSTLAKVS
jgi:fructokinase